MVLRQMVTIHHHKTFAQLFVQVKHQSSDSKFDLVHNDGH